MTDVRGTDPARDPAPAGPAHALGPPPGGSPKVKELHERITEVLKTCYDPEIPVDIYQLGLIYRIEVDEQGNARIDMTLTSPACPVAGTLPPEVESKVAAVEGIESSKVEVVWDPTWTPDMMTEAARLELGMF